MVINEYVAMKLHEQDIRRAEHKGENSTNRAINEIINDFKSNSRRRGRKLFRS